MNNPPFKKWHTAYDQPSYAPYDVLQREWIDPTRHNWWREFPLDNRNLIRNNVAGHYPPVKIDRTVQVTPEQPFEYAWQFVCSTIFPKNPEFARTNQIIYQP